MGGSGLSAGRHTAPRALLPTPCPSLGAFVTCTGPRPARALGAAGPPGDPSSPPASPRQSDRLPAGRARPPRASSGKPTARGAPSCQGARRQVPAGSWQSFEKGGVPRPPQALAWAVGSPGGQGAGSVSSPDAAPGRRQGFPAVPSGSQRLPAPCAPPTPPGRGALRRSGGPPGGCGFRPRAPPRRPRRAPLPDLEPEPAPGPRVDAPSASVAVAAGPAGASGPKHFTIALQNC